MHACRIEISFSCTFIVFQVKLISIWEVVYHNWFILKQTEVKSNLEMVYWVRIVLYGSRQLLSKHTYEMLIYSWWLCLLSKKPLSLLKPAMLDMNFSTEWESSQQTPGMEIKKNNVLICTLQLYLTAHWQSLAFLHGNMKNVIQYTSLR